MLALCEEVRNAVPYFSFDLTIYSNRNYSATEGGFLSRKVTWISEDSI